MNPYDSHILNKDGSKKCLKLSLIYIYRIGLCDACDKNKPIAALMGIGRKETINICKDCLLRISEEFKD